MKRLLQSTFCAALFVASLVPASAQTTCKNTDGTTTVSDSVWPNGVFTQTCGTSDAELTANAADATTMLNTLLAWQSAFSGSDVYSRAVTSLTFYHLNIFSLYGSAAEFTTPADVEAPGPADIGITYPPDNVTALFEQTALTTPVSIDNPIWGYTAGWDQQVPGITMHEFGHFVDAQYTSVLTGSVTGSSSDSTVAVHAWEADWAVIKDDPPCQWSADDGDSGYGLFSGLMDEAGNYICTDDDFAGPGWGTNLSSNPVPAPATGTYSDYSMADSQTIARVAFGNHLVGGGGADSDETERHEIFAEYFAMDMGPSSYAGMFIERAFLCTTTELYGVMFYTGAINPNLTAGLIANNSYGDDNYFQICPGS